MSTSLRTLPRLMCALLLAACADTDNPTAPIDSAIGPPQLIIEGGSTSPTPEEFAEMPAEFSTYPTIIRAWTDVGFLSYESRAYGQAFMEYFATNAEQAIEMDLLFENAAVTSGSARSAQSNWLPYIRTLWTTTGLGVSGACGHLVNGRSQHEAWHQFIFSGGGFLKWGNAKKPTNDSKEQPACAPPPPPDYQDDGGGGGGGGEYDKTCEMCQQWLYYMDGILVDEWWECTPVDSSYCGYAT